MYGSVGATAANLLLNRLFIPRFGYIAAAYTTLVCYLLQAAIDYWAMRHVIREKIYGNIPLATEISLWRDMSGTVQPASSPSARPISLK